MKTKKHVFKSLILAVSLFSYVSSHSEEKLNFLPLKSTQFFNAILHEESAIDTINHLRPKIFIYTDFGGGQNKGKSLLDLQTSGEIASAAWKETLQQELHINDSAAPLAREQASVYLAKSFPYAHSCRSSSLPSITTIVVHVIDPGVGNNQHSTKSHPRSLILRHDGTLFIGPDNGTLTFACPPGSIAAAFTIDPEKLHSLSQIDLASGGTFHGRDLFCEAAFRLAAGTISLNELGTPYPSLDLKNRLALDKTLQELLITIQEPLEFTKLSTDRLVWDIEDLNETSLFEKAFLLGVIQSPLYEDKEPLSITQAKKLFILLPKKADHDLIAVVNKKTHNIFIGPNNGLATAFFKNYEEKDIHTFSISEKILEAILEEKNNELATQLIEKQPSNKTLLKQVDLLAAKPLISKNTSSKTCQVEGRIWLDPYGNIKTTLTNDLLQDAKKHPSHIKVLLNGVEKSVILANTFSEVADNELFLYSGSSAAIGQNPHRSARYLEITSNGSFGKFGADFFEKDGKKPCAGQTISISIEYLAETIKTS